jgi:SAM-dependent methyltransferase
MKKMIKSIPVLGPVIRKVYRAVRPRAAFSGSERYWIDRYEAGGNSGDGSYRRLAEFKAEIINGFVARQGIASVMEFGCGDGNQLTLAQYPSYIGFDVSPKAIALCRQLFRSDPTKSFKLMREYGGESAELTLSLDVLYHLVEDAVFEAHMAMIFDASRQFVIIYASDREDKREEHPAHVRHRKFSRWVEENRADWRLLEHIPNRYPYRGDTKTGSFSDFFIYAKPGTAPS